MHTVSGEAFGGNVPARVSGRPQCILMLLSPGTGAVGPALLPGIFSHLPSAFAGIPDQGSLTGWIGPLLIFTPLLICIFSPGRQRKTETPFIYTYQGYRGVQFGLNVSLRQKPGSYSKPRLAAVQLDNGNGIGSVIPECFRGYMNDCI
jgi:hypothetical protein